MTITDAVLERVRSVDPIADVDLDQWSTSDDGRRVFDRVVGASVVAQRTPPRHRARWIAGAAIVTGALATAAAASGILGEPAPEKIRSHIAAVDDGLPDDLRLDPDVEHARAVASTASAVLYAADLQDGGYCMEVATEGDQPRGAVCVTVAHLDDRALEVTAPIPSGTDSALVVAGRVNDERVQRVEIRYSNGTTGEVRLGLDRFWIVEVPVAARAAVLAGGAEIAGIGADGIDVATLTVPPLADDDPDGTARDRAQPIFVSTISDGSDLTLLLGVEGSVNVADASTLELVYPDGTTAPIAIAPDGSYRFVIPDDRHSDFADAWGRLVARSADGEEVASLAISSVANSHRTP